MFSTESPSDDMLYIPVSLSETVDSAQPEEEEGEEEGGLRRKLMNFSQVRS